MARTTRHAGLLTLMASVLCSAATGCVQRTVTVTSEPPGALVWLNDREVGRTPVTVPFTFYGTYDVRLEAEGREPFWTTAEAEPPWWEHPPIDLVGEAFGGDVALDWHFVLTKAEPTDDEATDRLIEHARQMRAKTEAGP
ncbi:MAG: PEGA domain-containing protein [Planctomycetota bacterium]